jgi:Sulfotransferase domain
MIGLVKVIGAGLPRTVTLTQKIALEMLGFGPCYHMVTVLADLTLTATQPGAVNSLTSR